MKNRNRLTKGEQVPRYHARETAVARATMEGASVVLGSATPSVDAYFKAKQGEYTLLELTRRAKGQNLASVYTVDMREELKKGKPFHYQRPFKRTD